MNYYKEIRRSDREFIRDWLRTLTGLEKVDVNPGIYFKVGSVRTSGQGDLIEFGFVKDCEKNKVAISIHHEDVDRVNLHICDRNNHLLGMFHGIHPEDLDDRFRKVIGISLFAKKK